jgi:hypothetical protein
MATEAGRPALRLAAYLSLTFAIILRLNLLVKFKTPRGRFLARKAATRAFK